MNFSVGNGKNKKKCGKKNLKKAAGINWCSLASDKET